MNRTVFIILICAASFLFLAFGCTSTQQPSAQQLLQQTTNVSGAAQQSIPQGIGAGQTAGLKEWKSPDGAVVLQVPEGWQANEKQVDKCTVNWAVANPEGTSSAYMDNQVLIFKSDAAKQTYKSYGLAGVDAAPVSGYLGAEQGIKQVFAPLTGASDVRMAYIDTESGKEFSKAVCIQGLVACDAMVFEAAYTRNGVLMRGKYLVQAYDFGEGMTWWMNVWGYTAPAAEWDAAMPVLEAVFYSAKYSDQWASKCQSSSDAQSAILEVIKSRQSASGNAADAWDEYIKGG